MPQIIFINLAKAIGIILVVIGHFFPVNCPAWYKALHDVIYSFHMPLFMFASGYIYFATLKAVEYHKFISKKIKRLLVPYWSISVLVISIKLISGNSSLQLDHPVTAFSYVEMLYSPAAGGFLWFVFALFIIFAIIPFFKTPESRLSLFVVSLVLKYLPIAITFKYPAIFCLDYVINYLPYFMLGIIVLEHRAYFRIWVSLHYSVVMLLFVAGCAAVILWPGSIIVNVIAPYIGIFAVLRFCLFLETKHAFWPVSALLSIAAASYTIYLWHTTFQGGAKAIIAKFVADTGDLVFALSAVIVIVIGISVPWVLHTGLFRKYRLTKLLFGL